MKSKLPAFSLVEMLTGILVIALIMGAMTIKAGASRQGIRREAERIAAYIDSLTKTADRYRNPFNLEFAGGSFSVHWVYKTKDMPLLPSLFKKDPKYKLSVNLTSNKVQYSIKNNNFSPGCTITLEEITSDDIQDRSRYYIIIATIGGRIRTSADPPKNWKVKGEFYVE